MTAAAAAAQQVASEEVVDVTPPGEESVLSAGRISSSGKSKKHKPAGSDPGKAKAITYRKGARITDKDMQGMMNKMLMREVIRVTNKKKQLKVKKAKRKRRNPTDKQKAQWAHFADTVKKAKRIYHSGPGKKPEDWNIAMKKASGKLPMDASDIYQGLVEGLDEHAAEDMDE